MPDLIEQKLQQATAEGKPVVNLWLDPSGEPLKGFANKLSGGWLEFSPGAGGPDVYIRLSAIVMVAFPK